MREDTVNEVLQFVEENDVKFVRLAFCDLFGTLKNISWQKSCPLPLHTAFPLMRRRWMGL